MVICSLCVSKVNNVYPIELKVVALSADMAAWMDDGERVEPTHQEIVERLAGIAMPAMARGWKVFRSDSDDLASPAGSSVFQNGCGVSEEWSERDGDYGRTCGDPWSGQGRERAAEFLERVQASTLLVRCQSHR